MCAICSRSSRTRLQKNNPHHSESPPSAPQQSNPSRAANAPSESAGGRAAGALRGGRRARRSESRQRQHCAPARAARDAHQQLVSRAEPRRRRATRTQRRREQRLPLRPEGPCLLLHLRIASVRFARSHNWCTIDSQLPERIASSTC